MSFRYFGRDDSVRWQVPLDALIDQLSLELLVGQFIRLRGHAEA